jgi:integrase
MAVYKPTYTDKTTGEKKQQAVWWYEFVYEGERVREPAKTTRKTLALEAEKNRRRALEEASTTGKPISTAKDGREKRTRRVQVALAAYLVAYRAKDHRDKGVQIVVERSAPLEKHLGSLLAVDLTEERLMGYIVNRKDEGVGNRTINMEVAVLSRAMGMTWPGLKLEERRDVGKALSIEEEQRIVESAARSHSRMIHTIVRIALGTGMRRDEIRLMKWGQIDFEARQITVGKAKTAAGQGRVIPFGAMLEAVLSTYASWYASKLGEMRPDWHVFPFSNRRKPVDPERPVTSIKRAWESVRKTAGVQCRFHDLRHTTCTKMAEAGVSEGTMLAIMGHMSRAMIERYSHIRKAAKVEAMQAVESRSAFAIVVPKVSPKVKALEGNKPS